MLTTIYNNLWMQSRASKSLDEKTDILHTTEIFTSVRFLHNVLFYSKRHKDKLWMMAGRTSMKESMCNIKAWVRAMMNWLTHAIACDLHTKHTRWWWYLAALQRVMPWCHISTWYQQPSNSTTAFTPQLGRYARKSRRRSAKLVRCSSDNHVLE